MRQLDFHDLLPDARIPKDGVYRPDPDQVRSRLQKILSELRGEEKPNDDSLRMWRCIFPQMINWLPKEEADKFLSEFNEAMEKINAIHPS